VTIQSFVRAKIEDNFFSPDMPMLYDKRRHLIFVYGTLKRGFIRHSLLKSPYYVGEGWTKFRHYNMEYTKGANPFPIVTRKHNGHAIQGEVFLVPPETIVCTDFYESNGQYYDRIKTPIEITNANNIATPLVVDCWVYFGCKEHWEEYREKQGLRSCEVMTRKKNKKTYYTFMKKIFKWKTECFDAKCVTSLQRKALLTLV
jgi:gamma-glutamylaminecyclotransferase